jgi:hypothetical protein
MNKKYFIMLLISCIALSAGTSSCSIFRKKEKLGCAQDATGMSPDEVAARDNKRRKFKGGKKF